MLHCYVSSTNTIDVFNGLHYIDTMVTSLTPEEATFAKALSSDVQTQGCTLCPVDHGRRVLKCPSSCGLQTLIEG